MPTERSPIRIVTGVLLSMVFAPVAMAGHSHFPNSEWTLNLSKSDLGKGTQVKSDVVTFTQDDDARMEYSEVSVSADGTVAKLSWEGPQNGELRPMHGMPGALASFATADDSGHFIYPDGTSVHNWFWPSPDQRTLTYHVVGMKPNHVEFHQTLVYERTR